MDNPLEPNRQSYKEKAILREGWLCLDCDNDREFLGSFMDSCVIYQHGDMPSYGDFASVDGLDYEDFHYVECQRCKGGRVAYRFQYGDGNSYVDDVLGKRRKDEYSRRLSHVEQAALGEVIEYMEVELDYLRKGDYANVDAIKDAVDVLRKMLPAYGQLENE